VNREFWRFWVGETIGVLTFLIPLYFWLFRPLGHAERYLAPASGQALPADGA
jgi:hypothetical protein